MGSTTPEFSAFLREVGKRKVLSAAEEQDLARRAQAGDREAHRLMTEHNVKLVVSIAKRYSKMGFDLEDLVQEGSVGLLKAIERFDPDRGFKFSTYATWWIKQAVHRYMAGAGGNAIRVPGQLQRTRRRLRQHINANGGTIAEAAEALRIDPEEAIEATSGPRASVSLDAAMGDEEGSQDGRHAMIADPNAIDPADLLSESHPALIAAMSELTERQQLVLKMRFGFNGPAMARNDVAAELGVGSRVVQEEQKAAIRVLRRVMLYERSLAEGADEEVAELEAVFQAFSEGDEVEDSRTESV